MRLNLSYMLPIFGSKLSYPSFLVPCNNGLIQIESQYSIFNYNKDKDDYRYASKRRKQIKKSIYENNVVEDHHVIPKQYKYHKLIQEIEYDISCSKNLILMPTYYGYWVLKNKKHENTIMNSKINENAIIHSKGHYEYNLFVGSVLNDIHVNEDSIDDKKYHFWLFLQELKYNISNNNDDIPWN